MVRQRFFLQRLTGLRDNGERSCGLRSEFRQHRNAHSQRRRNDSGRVTPLNSLLTHNADRNHWLRITTPEAGESYVQFNVAFIAVHNDEVGLTVEDAQLVGDDFALEQDTYTQFLFERHTSEQSITTTTNLPVWGELTERGSALGVISITSQEDPVTTGSQEEASAVVRYEERLAIGMLLTDDFGRTWGIRGSRTLGDRRYLEFDLSRTVEG